MKSALNKDSLNSIISEIFNTNQYNLVDSTQTLNNHIYKIQRLLNLAGHRAS